MHFAERFYSTTCLQMPYVLGDLVIILVKIEIFGKFPMPMLEEWNCFEVLWTELLFG
jgi:hypothetical protein